MYDTQARIAPTPRGTPQGSVHSFPAFAKLHPLLEDIERLRYSIYADDVTLWTAQVSDVDIQDPLLHAATYGQRMADIGWTSARAAKVGARTPAAKKSEPSSTFAIEGTRIPQVTRARIRGLHI